MARRALFVLAVVAACWLKSFALRTGDALHLLPRTMSVGRLAFFVLPGLVIAALAIYLARRWALFSRSELGLERSEWQRRHPTRHALILGGLLAGFAVAYMLPPINYALTNGLTYADFLSEIRSHEYRSTLEPYEPLDASGLSLSFLDDVVFPPLMEEVPYRALLVPLVLPVLGRWGAVLVSGAVFFLTHWLAYQQAPNLQHFLGGVVLAYVFLRVGLAGSLATHAGSNAGIWLLAVWAACAAP
jgi:membrane protease YdiL (CAAX protease family)